MKNIGILTFHYSDNYGAFLQAYAMQEWLKKNTSYNVEIIDYRPNFQVNPFSFKLKDRLIGKSIVAKAKAAANFAIEEHARNRRHNNFEEARNQLDTSKEIFYDNEFNTKNQYDYLILGSDQIWNPTITCGIDKVYFGTNSDDSAKRIAYAASCGVESYSLEEEKDISKLIKRVDCIGVREQASVDLLCKITDKKIVVNLDPTLLFDSEFWNTRIKTINYENYILVYQLKDNPQILEDAKRFSKETGKKILHFREPSIKKDSNFVSVGESGPFEFISYIKNADIILTDSFHATCFSVIFEKNFYTYLNPTRYERLKSLSQSCGFGDRVLNFGDCVENINNKNVYTENIKPLRKQSEEFLYESLE